MQLPPAVPPPVVIACSGCPHCREEIAEIRRAHTRWSVAGSAAGTAIVVTLWHVFDLLVRLPQ